MRKQQLLEILKEKQACAEALTWVRNNPGTPAELWQACPRSDWLLWLCGRLGIDRRLLVRAAIGCSYPALARIQAGEERPRRALDTALSWCEGGASLEEVRAAAHAAHAAVYAVYAAHAAVHAAYAAAYAAYAAAYAAYAADAAVYAADAAVHAAVHAAADAAHATYQESLAHSAGTVRRHIRFSAVAGGLGGVT